MHLAVGWLGTAVNLFPVVGVLEVRVDAVLRPGTGQLKDRRFGFAQGFLSNPKVEGDIGDLLSLALIFVSCVGSQCYSVCL